MDQRGNRRRAFHGIRQPDVKRKLRRLAGCANKKQEGCDGQDGIADEVVAAAQQRVDVGEAERTEIPHQCQCSEDEASVADAVDDESLVGRVARGLTVEIETDQQVRAQAHAFPADEKQDVVVRQDEREHGEHEQVQVSEEAVVAAFVRHVSGGIDMDQHAHASDEEQPDRGKRIEQEAEVGVERGASAVFLLEGEMRIARTEPGIDDLFERLAGAVREVRVLDDGEAGKQERDHHGAHANRVDRGLLQAAAEEEHHRGPEGREERNQVDVI